MSNSRQKSVTLKIAEGPIAERLTLLVEALKNANLGEHEGTLLCHLTDVAQGIVDLKNGIAATVDFEALNDAAFRKSPGYLAVLDMKRMEEDNEELMELPESLHNKLYGKFEKPYTAENCPKPTLTLSASFEVTEKKATVRGGGANRGQGANPDDQYIDMRHPSKNSRVYYSVFWDAFKQDGPANITAELTEEERKAQFYAGGGLGTKFIERMVTKNLIPKTEQRGYLRKWALEQKMEDNTPRFVKVG